MNNLSAILVDDEESARDVLEHLLLRFCPNVELKAKCESLPEAVKSIEEHHPHLVFLDIEMPNYAGYEIVNFFDDIQFHIIFVTAYEKYAIRAFEIAAVDYLLKPIEIARLTAAVARVQQRVDTIQQTQRLDLLGKNLQTNKLNNLIVADRGQQHVVAIDTIVAIEAMEAYCEIHTLTKKYTVSKNLKHYEVLLENTSEFIRTHKSWLINKMHLISYQKTELTLQLKGGISAKLSKYKKAEFEAQIR